MTQLTPHFSLEELTFSPTARRLGIDNASPPPEVLANLGKLARGLELVRAFLLAPMHIDSAYRSPQLNAAVGGVRDSAHLTGFAADFVCPGYGTPLAICRGLFGSGIGFDQLIQEGTWVHISFAPPMRQEVLTAHFDARGRASYIPGFD